MRNKSKEAKLKGNLNMANDKTKRLYPGGVVKTDWRPSELDF